MARLQILELPEGSSDDRPPFVLVVDQYVARHYITGLDQPEPVSEFDGITEKVGARAVLVFEETVDIPANEVGGTAEALMRAGEPVDADGAEHAGTTQIVYAHERTRLDLCSALLLSGDTTWRKLVEEAAQRQTATVSLARALDAHKVALLDALGMDRTRDWDDIRNAAAGLRKQRDEQAEAVERVRNLPDQPQDASAEYENPNAYLLGYLNATREAKRAITNPPAADA